MKAANINIKNNIRILLVNNGCGTEFHNYSHPASGLGEMANNYIAADGHFGNKSDSLVKNYAVALGFEYMCASNKEDFLSKVEYFCSDKIYNKPIIFEVFTNSIEESEALQKIRSLKTSTKGIIKEKVSSILSENTKSKIKKMLGK